MNKKITIKEIAELANVSIATISRVINNSGYVDEVTRKKVTDIIKKTGYIPNPAAKALSSKSINLPFKKCISVVIADTAKYGFANLFFSKVFYGIMEEAVETKYNLFTRIIKSQQNNIYDELNIMINNSDGVIAIGHGVENFVDELLKKNISFPIVLVESYSNKVSLKVNSVVIDNFAAAYSATKYLIECGHKKIGFIAGPDEYVTAKERYRGFLEALRSNNIYVNKDYISNGNLEYIGGYTSIVKMIKKIKRKNFPTAIFCANDFTAIGAKDALEKNGFIIPDDVSLIGFDNIELTQQIVPALTTLDVPKEELGRLAVKRLNDLIFNKETSPIQIIVKAKFIERESVKKLK
ncbi:MAG: LacI family transcriptional regulator [Endomicrobia bacterium]|nr:LacI family transcriptional regulator [Endomicrobiia bacterium]